MTALLIMDEAFFGIEFTSGFLVFSLNEGYSCLSWGLVFIFVRLSELGGFFKVPFHTIKSI